MKEGRGKRQLRADRVTRRRRRNVGRMPLSVVVLVVFALFWSGTAKPERTFAAAGDTQNSAGAAANRAADESQSGKTQPQTTEFRLSQDRYDKAVAYSRAGYAVYFISVAWGILVLVLLLEWGVVARLRDFAERAISKKWLQGVIFAPLLLIALAIFDLPIGMYWHSLSLRYEQSVQHWGSWFWDWTKGELLSAVMGIIVATILLAVVRWKPQRWWLYFWFAAVPLALFIFFISPWFIDPMFHKFRPLEESNPQLVASIEKLTERAGMPIPAERMFLMEASEKTNQINAYVTGIGASKRVVIWDNAILKTKPDELLFIVGHETGHYALGHVMKGFALFLLGLFIGLYVAYRLLGWMLRRWGPRWGIRGQDDWAALAALMLIGSVLGFVGDPIGNGVSRKIEHAADVYGLEVTHGLTPNSSEVAAHAFQTMGELDLADPNPPRIITIWLYSHPPLADRLQFAKSYDPWDKGEPPKYVK